MGLISKIGHFAGGALKKVGQIGGAVTRGVGVVKSIYDVANKASGGLIGNTLESLPVVGNTLKSAGKVLGNDKLLNKVNKISHRLEDVGGAVDKAARGFDAALKKR